MLIEERNVKLEMWLCVVEGCDASQSNLNRSGQGFICLQQLTLSLSLSPPASLVPLSSLREMIQAADEIICPAVVRQC